MRVLWVFCCLRIFCNLAAVAAIVLILDFVAQALPAQTNRVSVSLHVRIRWKSLQNGLKLVARAAIR